MILTDLLELSTGYPNKSGFKTSTGLVEIFEC
jgi:hypothetical protein